MVQNWQKRVLVCSKTAIFFTKYFSKIFQKSYPRFQDDSTEQWRGGCGLASAASTPRRQLQTFSTAPPLPDVNTATKRPKDDKVSNF
jgi:hypothetical protein